MFRNESESVVVKAKAKETKRGKAREKSSSPNSSSIPFATRPKLQTSNGKEQEGDLLELTLAEQQERDAGFVDFPEYLVSNHDSALVKALAPSHSIFPTIEERAFGYFSANSSAWLRKDITNDLCSQTTIDDVLTASMSAMGMATFSQAAHSPELMMRARRDYIKALQLTNAALRSPTQVKKDSTLFAVMILSIFETITGSNERSIAAWTEHINGAAALVKLRGPGQFRTEAGQRMYLQVTSSLMLSCIQRTVPMPQHIIALRAHAEKVIDVSSPVWKLSAIIIDFTIFRADAYSRNPPPALEILARALDIESRFLALFEDTPESWRYEVAYSDEKPDVIWNGKFHVYKEAWMAHIWNGMRTCRIMLHEAIRDQLPLLSRSDNPVLDDKELELQERASMEVIIQLRDDVLASVPQNTQDTMRGTSFLADGSRAYFILWPLYLVAAMNASTEEIRAWCIKRLRIIGDELGIRQAEVLADFLQRKKDVVVWEEREPEQPSRIRVEVIEEGMDWTSSKNGVGLKGSPEEEEMLQSFHDDRLECLDMEN